MSIGNQPALEFYSSHRRHAHIQDQTVGIVQMMISNSEFLRRSKCFHGESDGPHESLKRFAD
jgi:hypothetical protein